MNKQVQLNNLLKENRHTLLNGEVNNAICYDGIVNEELYENIVVLLKETNGVDATGDMPEALEDWDYYRWLREQQVENKPEKRIDKNGKEYIEENVFYPSTFRKLCYWLSLLFDTLENEKADTGKFLENGQVNIAKVRKVLSRVAIVNLKKSWGYKQTNSGDLEKYVKNSAISKVLVEQMRELSPKIVLCCSPTVYWLATQVYGQVKHNFCKPSASIPGKNIEFAFINNAIYINFYHPQYYGKTDKEFSDYAIETFEYLKSICK